MLKTFSSRLLEHVRAAVPAVTDVSIGTRGQPATVRVSPPDQQAAAQAAIDSFDWSDAAQQTWEDAQKPERQVLRQAAAQAVQDNLDFLALASPSNAAVLAQVRRLAQQMNAVIRRVVQLD